MYQLPQYDENRLEVLHALIAANPFATLVANAFERGAKPWRMEEMPADCRESMLYHIVGFQIPIVALQGIFKLNQSSSREDRTAVVAELEMLGTDSAKAMAAAISHAAREK